MSKMGLEGGDGSIILRATERCEREERRRRSVIAWHRKQTLHVVFIAGVDLAQNVAQ